MSKKEQKTEKWERGNKVLGHCQKTHIARPRQLLSVPKREDVGGDGGDEEDDAEGSDDEAAAAGKWSQKGALAADAVAVFTRSRWKVRMKIEKASQYLGRLRDIMRLLEVNRGEARIKEMQAQRTRLLGGICRVLGFESKRADGDAEPTVVLNAAALQSVLAFTKGRRLTAQALPLLPTVQKHMLLPEMMTALLVNKELPADEPKQFLALGPNTQYSLALVGCLQGTQPSPQLTAKCLEHVLAPQTAASLKAILHNKCCAQALQALLQTGSTICPADAETADQWAALQTKFIQLAQAATAL